GSHRKAGRRLVEPDQPQASLVRPDERTAVGLAHGSSWKDSPAAVEGHPGGKMIFRTTLIALLTLVSTSAWAEILVVGHRGTRVHAPENTIPAFLKAIELGADLLEMDVRETRDGVLVIMHDADVARTTDGSGAVSGHTLAELKQLDAGSWFGPEWRG